MNFLILFQKRIVHRDLKVHSYLIFQAQINFLQLENILCIDDKRVVISDFGFAKQLEPGQKLKGEDAILLK